MSYPHSCNCKSYYSHAKMCVHQNKTRICFKSFQMSNWRLFKNASKSICEEAPEVEMNDGAHTIFLSTKGSNEHEVPEELVKF